MVFGEIVEPSTRALVEDDYEDDDDEEETPRLSWNVPPTLSPSVGRLFLAETAPLRTIFQTCVFGERRPSFELHGTSVKVYELHDTCVVICDVLKSGIDGLIVEKIAPLLSGVQEVVVMTCSQGERSSCVRQLSYGVEYTHPKLDVPDLVAGLSAGVFSYCIHKRISCSLFKASFDAAPLDSINTMPFLNLLKTLCLNLLKPYKFQEAPPRSNLYV